MATPNDKLAESLQVLQELQARGVIAIRSKQLTRTHRERLLKQGFLKEVMKGWYIPARPDAAALLMGLAAFIYTYNSLPITSL